MRHRKTRDGRERDRIKAVLLRAEGWSLEQIAQALRIHLETVRDHLRDYGEAEKLKPENGGSLSKLNEAPDFDSFEGLKVEKVRKSRAS